MTTSFEIANFWMIDLQRYQWVGLLFHFLGLFFILSLWWHQDRGWRAGRWCLLGYFMLTSIFRYLKWIVFGLFSPSPTDSMRYFILRSGYTGFLVCALVIVLIIIDIRKSPSRFDHFSPEDWAKTAPSTKQVMGLLIAGLALWSPLLPDPGNPWMSIFTYGFPTTFGVTITNVLIFLTGLLVAGSRTPDRKTVGLLAVIAGMMSVVSEPLSVHGVCYSVVVLILGASVYFSKMH